MAVDPHIDTILAGIGHFTDMQTGGLVPPLHMGVTHVLGEGGPASGYARSGPADGSHFERMMILAEKGADAVGFASGASAAQAAVAILPEGCHLLMEANGYYEFRDMIARAGAVRGIMVETVDLCDLDTARAAVRPGQTALIWAELPTNPQWRVPDIRALSDLARAAGAALLVDSTAATPVLCRPLEHGADIVLHSATKFLNGHGDLTAGALVLADAENSMALKNYRTAHGTVLSPMSEWLLLRGIRTLAVRMERACGSALTIAEWLASRDDVEVVYYPGLPQSPDFDRASRQFLHGFGSMLSFCVSSRAKAAAVTKAAKVFRQSTSLGSTESLIEHRAVTEGVGTRCPDTLIRLSIGLEHPSDLIADLADAMDG